MTVKRIVAGGVVAGVLAAAAAGAGIAPAGADPGWKPDKDRHDQRVDRGWNDHDRGWRGDDRDWDKWWRDNRWRNDDRPPWGWGPPPPLHWRGHPPQFIDYWGYRVSPIWDPGFRSWGFWLFGVFIPVVVI
jgi:hypothetical protein